MTALDVAPVPKSDALAAKMKSLFFSFIALVPIYNYICLFSFLSHYTVNTREQGQMSALFNVHLVPRSVPGT